MKIIVFFLLIIGFNVTFFLNPIIAQVSFYPRSLLEDNKLLLKNDDELVVYSTSIPNKDSLLSIEEILNQDGKIRPQLYGYAYEVNLNTQNSGIWETLKNGDRIWRLKISCPKAYSINLLFEDFKLSESSDICIYNNKHDFIIGPFNSRFNKKHGKFATHLIKGDTIIIELYESKSEFGLSKFSLTRIVYGFLDAFSDFEYFSKESNTEKFQSSLSCNRNINCPEGDEFCSEKYSVALILVSAYGASDYRWCSGSLINNVRNDYIPYFLTAFHCVDFNQNGLISTSEIDWLNTWVFRFGYFVESCNSGSIYPTFDYSGADLVSSWITTDFALLQLEDQPQAGDNIFMQDVFFNGWDNRDFAHSQGIGIHHPRGDVMKISIDYNSLQIAGNPIGLPCTSFPSGNTHLRCLWDLGTTEGGSSGSPLFDVNRRVIGQLHGGCNCIQPLNVSYYGRFSESWFGGGTSTTSLHHWLDPDNTGAETLDGISLPFLRYGFYSNSGSQTYNAHDFIEIGSSQYRSFLLDNGGNLTLKAGKEIVIRPCTIIKSGSIFRAYIDDVDCNDGIATSSDSELWYNGSICSNPYPPIAKQANEVESIFDNQVFIKITPNPFTEDTRISISLSNTDKISLSVYDLLGNRIAVLADMTELSAGTHNFTFSGHNINSGVYYVVMSSSTERISHPLMLIK